MSDCLPLRGSSRVNEQVNTSRKGVTTVGNLPSIERLKIMALNLEFEEGERRTCEALITTSVKDGSVSIFRKWQVNPENLPCICGV